MMKGGEAPTFKDDELYTKVETVNLILDEIDLTKYKNFYFPFSSEHSNFLVETKKRLHPSQQIITCNCFNWTNEGHKYNDAFMTLNGFCTCLKVDKLLVLDNPPFKNFTKNFISIFRNKQNFDYGFIIPIRPTSVFSKTYLNSNIIFLGTVDFYRSNVPDQTVDTGLLCNFKDESYSTIFNKRYQHNRDIAYFYKYFNIDQSEWLKKSTSLRRKEGPTVLDMASFLRNGGRFDLRKLCSSIDGSYRPDYPPAK